MKEKEIYRGLRGGEKVSTGDLRKAIVDRRGRSCMHRDRQAGERDMLYVVHTSQGY